MPAHQVVEVILWNDTKDNIYIRQPEVGIHEYHALTLFGKTDSEVGGDISLADAALAAGYCDNTGR